jgi:hypothetical protein
MMTQVYSMPAAADWLTQIELVCGEVEIDHVDILLDQADWINAALPVLRVMKPQAPWFPLFTDTPEEHLLHVSPLLIRLDITQPEHKAWLAECLRYYSINRLLILISPLPFEDLSKATRAFSQAKRGGRIGLLRYYDPRVFPVLMNSIFTGEQRSLFQQMTAYWSWLDRDEQPQWLQGKGEAQLSPATVPECIEMSDQQVEWLGCITDAQILLDEDRSFALGRNNELSFLRLYDLAVQASNSGYFGCLADYVEIQI